MDETGQTSIQNPVIQTPKTNPLLFLFVGLITLVFGIAVGLLVGKYIYTPKPTSSPIVSVSPTPVSIADPTANWKTSNNIVLGASFRYPNDWVISETETYTSVVKNPVTATVVDACPGYSLLVSKYDPFTNYARANKIIKGELDGQTTEVWENINKCSEVMVFVNQRPANNIKPKYVISFTSADSTNSKRVFDQILSTFKFINTSTPSISSSQNYPKPTSWKTASISNLGISVCLPPQWVVGSDSTGNIANLYFERDAQYRPRATSIETYPYTGQSLRDEYLNQKFMYDPTYKESAQVSEVSINAKEALVVTIPDADQYTVINLGNKLIGVESGPEPQVNSSQTAFKKDLYTLIGCIQ